MSQTTTAAAPAAVARPRVTTLRPFSMVVISPDQQRRATFTSLGRRAGAQRVADYETGQEARRHARRDFPGDVCVIDGSVRDVPILGFVRQLHTLGWHRTILVTSRHDVLGVRGALSAGVRGYVVANGLPSTSSRAAESQQLTDREIEVLQAVSEGMSNREIGEELGLSALTVKSHMARISRKLGTGDRAELVALAMRAGVVR